MLISTNKIAETQAFEHLLERLVLELRSTAKRKPDIANSLHGTRLEHYSFDLLKDLAGSTPFDGSIELVSGQLFPDIIAKKYYGVEVKSSKSGSWRSIGSSVAEGTRISGIERIYLLFGKIADPIDFRCRLYQDCLSGVAVTHSPRYTIDMELGVGETFFDELKVSYDALRQQDAPLDIVIEHLRSKLKPGETTWWLSNNNSRTTKAIVRLWSSLDPEEKELLRLKGFCLFPELLGRSQNKFHRMLLWLSTEEGIVAGNLRDQYTAGGQVAFSYQGKDYLLPRILYRLIVSLDKLSSILSQIDSELLQDYWQMSDIEDRVACWIRLCSEYSCEISDFPLANYMRNHLVYSTPTTPL